MAPVPSCNRSILGLVAAAAAVFADPMPYDSIGNPLNKLPASDRTIQRKGDSLNIVPNRVRVNQAGYRQMDVVAGYAKFYCVGCVGTAFTVHGENGALAGSGTLTSKGATVSGKFTAYASNSAEHAYNGEGDWKKGYPMVGTTVSGALTQGILPATLPAGRYVIRVGADSSVPFIVSDNVYAMATSAALKFFGVARSGDYESWFHGPSHMWDGWLYDSAARKPDGTYKYKGALKGGWYDCGNHLKEARTNSYPLATLGMLAATMPEKDADRYALYQNYTTTTDRIPVVLREAWVGGQYVINTWRQAKSVADDMYLWVGDLSWDFAWWGRPENHDAVLNPTRGGRKERYLKRDWGSASMADFAAGMAFLSRLYRPYDRAHADSALAIARAMYKTAQTANKKEESEDYTADNFAFDDLGLAAIALLWATGESQYLQDAVFAKGLNDGVGGVCKSTAMSPDKQLRLFEGGYFACDPDDGMKKKGGPTDYTTVHSLALYSFAKLILADADTAARYGIRAGQRDTFLLRAITQMPGLWNQSPGNPILIPTGDQYNPTRLTYDSIWYSMGIGYGKSGWWNKYQFGNLADLYMFYDMTGLVEGRQIVDKPGNTDWKRKEVLQVLLGGLNYMMGTNALDVSYLLGIGRKNPMHPHHRAANPEGKNVPGAFYNYTIPVGGLYGGLLTGPANAEEIVEKFGDYRMTEAICPDASAAVMIPLMGLSSETPVLPPRATVKVLYTTDTSAVIHVDLDKWGTVKLGYGLDTLLAAQGSTVSVNEDGGSFRIEIGRLQPATQYYFHVVATDLQGLVSVTSKWPNGTGDSLAFNFTTKAHPAVPPLYGDIKVCNVTSDSAEIMWYTPNGEYLSSVRFADSAKWRSATYSVVDTDFVGDIPVRFHRVKLSGLKPKTTYNFQVGVPGAYDPTVGCFRTPGEDVKFDIRTTRYTWGGMPAMGLAVVNQDVKSYDSLQIRLYVNGTRANILDLAARVDIAFAYRADGFADSGLFSHTKNVQRSRPQLIDPACNPDIGSCAWYFDLPLHGAVMETQARWRLDVVFDRHNLIRDSTEILNMAPTHDPFAGTDWSFRPHVAGGDGGLSPLDYPGVPLMSKNAIDSIAMDIPVNPYIAVYRRNEFIYGFSPSAAEQATKRVVYAMDVAFEKPFDVANGNTIQLGTGSSTRLKGTLNAYDAMMPAVKGYITSVWVNGVALTAAERKAALARQADGSWKVDLPLRLVTGTNKVDVTFFAGSDSVDVPAGAGTCGEGKGCAFYNANWFVNHVSNMTTSILSVVDAAEAVVGPVAPDSSWLRIRVKDGNADLSKLAADAVTVSVTNSRTKGVVILSLPETGANTGVFQTDLLKAVSSVPVPGQLQTLPGDTLVVRYMDASDSADVGEARIWAKTSWPNLVSAVVTRACGGTGTVTATLDGQLGGAGGATIAGGQVSLLGANGDTIYSKALSVAEIAIGADAKTVGLEVPAWATTGVAGGVLGLVLDAGNGKMVTTTTAIADGIGPWLDSAKIVENLSGSPIDTLYVWAKETTAPLGLTLPVLLKRGAASLPTTGLVVDHAQLLDASTGKWVYAIRGGAIKAKDSLRWNPGSKKLEDLLANPNTNQRLVFKIQGGTAAPAIRDSLVVTYASGSFLSELYLRGSKLPERTKMVYEANGHRLAGHNDSLNYDYWLDLDSIPGRAIEWYLYTQHGLLGPNVWGLSRVDNVPGVTASDLNAGTSGGVNDLAGNPALDCPSLLKEVKLVSRPAPFSRAWIRDADGDGRADLVTMVFRKTLVAGDLPDSIQVGFGAAGSVRRVPVSLAMATDSVLTVALGVPFALSETRGAAVDGSGSLLVWKTGEATGPYSLVDSVGPVLLSAKLRYGANSSATDTLELEFSEPVVHSNDTIWLASQSVGVLSNAGAPRFASSTRWTLPVDTGVVVPGDSVRPPATGAWLDSSASNRVAPFHPWVVATGGERAPLGGWYQDTNGDGAVDLATVVFARAPRTRPAMRFLWPSAAGTLDTFAVDSGAWTMNSDGKTASIAVGPFAKGVTSSPGDQLGRWLSDGSVSPFAMADLVAPVIVSANLRYASESGVPDTLKVRWSERLSWISGPLVSHRNDSKGVPTENVAYSGVLPDADGLGATLFLDSSSTQLKRGDSARLAPTAGDLLGNVAGDPTVWTPVVFGLRPPRLETKLHSYVEFDGIWPFVSRTPFQTWLRGQDVFGDERWILPDGTVPPDTTASRFLGLTLTLNQFLEGFAYIFDNGGVYVASVDFEEIRKAAAEGRFQADESGIYKVRLAWDGRSASGRPVASGPYHMRLILKFDVEGEDKPRIVNRVFTLGFKRSVK